MTVFYFKKIPKVKCLVGEEFVSKSDDVGMLSVRFQGMTMIARLTPKLEWTRDDILVVKELVGP